MGHFLHIRVEHSSYTSLFFSFLTFFRSYKFSTSTFHSNVQRFLFHAAKAYVKRIVKNVNPLKVLSTMFHLSPLFTQSQLSNRTGLTFLNTLLCRMMHSNLDKDETQGGILLSRLNTMLS